MAVSAGEMGQGARPALETAADGTTGALMGGEKGGFSDGEARDMTGGPSRGPLASVPPFRELACVSGRVVDRADGSRRDLERSLLTPVVSRRESVEVVVREGEPGFCRQNRLPCARPGPVSSHALQRLPSARPTPTQGNNRVAPPRQPDEAGRPCLSLSASPSGPGPVLYPPSP